MEALVMTGWGHFLINSRCHNRHVCYALQNSHVASWIIDVAHVTLVTTLHPWQGLDVMQVGTYNVNGRSPPPGIDLSPWLAGAEQADIVIVGFQEIVPLTANHILNGANRVLCLLVQLCVSCDDSLACG
jgi:hypothetical protein